MYALRFKGTKKLVGFHAMISDDQGGRDSSSEKIRYRLAKSSNNIWTVYNQEIAENAAKNNTGFYSATFETPMNEFVDELEVVELKIK